MHSNCTGTMKPTNLTGGTTRASRPAWGGYNILHLFCVVLLFNTAQITRAEVVFVEPNSAIIPTGASEDCRTVLSRNITECDHSITVPNSSAKYTAAKLDITCAATCRSALVTYISDIRTQCAPGLTYTPGWGFTEYPERVLHNLDVTCIRSGGANSEYCNICLQNLFNNTDVETSPFCSECYVKIYQTKLNCKWGYSESQETAYSRLLSSCSIPATNYPITYTPPSSTVTATTGTGATSTPVPRCDATYTVGPDDTCSSISAAKSIADNWLASINNLDPQCRGLVPGSKLCLPPACKTHLVAVNDTCSSIIDSAGYPIRLPRFLSWNFAINSGCTNIASFVGKHLCITPPGTTTIPEPDPRLPRNTLAPVPPNAEPHSNIKCAWWHCVTTGDTCAQLAVKYNIPLKHFYFLNPNVTSDCLNLKLDVSYCVKPVGSLNNYDGFNPYPVGITMTDKLDVGHTLTRHNYTFIHKFIPATGWPRATNISRVARPKPTVTESYTLCPEWTDLPFDTEEWPEEGDFPPEVYENEEWLAEYQRVCEPDWALPLPTDPPTFPPLEFPNTPDTATNTGTVSTTTTSTGTVSTTTSTGTVNTTTTSTGTVVSTATTTCTAPSVTPPGSVREGMAENCNKYHLHVTGDTCCSMSNDAGITLEQFYAWNPAVGSDCEKLWPGYAYCISVAVATTTTTTPTATIAPPGPKQEGA